MVRHGGRPETRVCSGAASTHRCRSAGAQPILHIGTPGIVEALRAGSVSMVNALGSGILETRAFLAFMPAICRHLLGEEQKLPSIATWWCGQEAERAACRRQYRGHGHWPGLFDAGPSSTDEGPVRYSRLLSRKRREPPSANGSPRNGGKLVGPGGRYAVDDAAWVLGRLTPRPMSLGLFAARTRDGWQIMPGASLAIGSGR